MSESIEWKTWNNVDPKDPTAETVKDVRVLVSFYAAWGDVNVSNDPVHKKKFCVPVSGTQIFPRPSERPKRIQKPRYILYWNKDSCRTEGYWAKLFHNCCPCIKNRKGGVNWCLLNSYTRLLQPRVAQTFYVSCDCFKKILRDEWFNRKIQRDVWLEPLLCHHAPLKFLTAEFSVNLAASLPAYLVPVLPSTLLSK